jgi:nitrogen fixation NifU-like protein
MSAALDELRDLYQELILDHGRSPHNRRKPADYNREALGHNPLCGDKLTIYLKLDADQRVADVAFEGQGCAISVASASMMTDMLKGKSKSEAETLFDYFHKLCTQDDAPQPPALSEDDLDRLAALSGVRQFPIRVKCATLAWHAMQAALQPAAGANTVSTEQDKQS